MNITDEQIERFIVAHEEIAKMMGYEVSVANALLEVAKSLDKATTSIKNGAEDVTNSVDALGQRLRP